MTANERAILVSPLETILPEWLTAVTESVTAVFGLPTAVATIPVNMKPHYDATRRQYHSTPILAALAEAAPTTAIRILAITRKDLFIPILTHVYGEAQLDGTACIVSTHRLNHWDSSTGPNQVRDRIVKEAVHELGHTFGLRHCAESGCTMHYCRSVADVDRKSGILCRYCRTLLNDVL